MKNEVPTKNNRGEKYCVKDGGNENQTTFGVVLGTLSMRESLTTSSILKTIWLLVRNRWETRRQKRGRKRLKKEGTDERRKENRK